MDILLAPDHYDVAWEFSALGETSLPSLVLVNATIAGNRIQRLRSRAISNTDSTDHSCNRDNESTVVRRRRGRRKGWSKTSYMNRIRESLEDVSDVDSYGAAPESGTESGEDEEEMKDEAPLEDGKSYSDNTDEDSATTTPDGLIDWLVFGKDANDMQEESQLDADPIFSGLQWELGSSINEPPDNKMDDSPATMKEEYKHLFKSPIDSVFAVLPYAFWDLMVMEINRYAGQYLENKRRKYIFGKKWMPVTVTDIITYFGMLIYFMLYPQTGRRLRSTWKDQDFNYWTKNMSMIRFQRISCTLHFNDNTDLVGLSMDSLHKVRPLLEILKRSLG